MKILAIETSCDDTCISIVEIKESKTKPSFKILANIVQSQDIHNQYGGVFPMMAKREHIKNIGPVYEEAMRKAKYPKIDAIAVTVGPGLEPALWVGIMFAEELSKKLGVPTIPVNHMEGHIFSIFPNKTKSFVLDRKKKIFPLISLLVSGGHTEIVLVKDFQKYKIIGSTRDDAAGEAFDKVARMLGLPYPGGPEISRLAKTERECVASGSEIVFPRPMIHSKDYDFSFSGLKTAVLYYIRDLPTQAGHGPLTEKLKSKIAKEFEDAVIDVLVHKTIKVIKSYKAKNLIVGGGVSANSHLQQTLKKKLKEIDKSIKLHFPTKNLSTDNALMIAIAGYFQYKNKKVKRKSSKLKACGNLAL